MHHYYIAIYSDQYIPNNSIEMLLYIKFCNLSEIGTVKFPKRSYGDFQIAISQAYVMLFICPNVTEFSC